MITFAVKLPKGLGITALLFPKHQLNSYSHVQNKAKRTVVNLSLHPYQPDKTGECLPSSRWSCKNPQSHQNLFFTAICFEDRFL